MILKSSIGCAFSYPAFSHLEQYLCNDSLWSHSSSTWDKCFLVNSIMML